MRLNKNGNNWVSAVSQSNFVINPTIVTIFFTVFSNYLSTPGLIFWIEMF